MDLSRTLGRTIAVIGLLLIGLAQPAMSQAHKMEITPTFGYQWGGVMQTYEGEVRLEDGEQYGVILGYRVQKELMVEFFWSYFPTRASFEPYYLYGGNSELANLDAKLGVHYFQLNGVWETGRRTTKPFLGAGFGMVMFSPENTKYSTEVRAAMNFSGGVKFYLSERIGLRLQGRLLMPLYFTGGGLWFGTGGVSVGASAGIPIVQGDLSAGLIIVI